MRRLLAILFIGVFAFNLAGHYVIFSLLQNRARVAMCEQMLHQKPAEFVHDLAFSLDKSARLDWETPGKEFNYQNEMYDVVGCDTLNNIVHIHCISDEKESELNNTVNTLIQNQNDNNQTPAGKTMCNLFKVFFALSFIPVHTSQILYTSPLLTHSFMQVNAHIYSPIVSILRPPII